MTYDFETMLERHGKDAIAVDALGISGHAPQPPKEGFDFIPMWVADMNFATAPSIQDAVIERVKHPAFGYFKPTEEYFDSIIDWHKRRNHRTDLTKDMIGYENGVLGGVMSALKALCPQGGPVLIHEPTYIGFTGVLTNAGYDAIHSPLIRDNGTWEMDYEDMEQKIIDHKIHTAIVCNPHNPCGRAWTKDELAKMMDIFERHQVWVISDEIWSDLMMNKHTYVPTQEVNDYAKMHTIAFYAPSKTFNLAGLIGSYHIVYNEWLKDQVQLASSISHYNDMNVLSMHALIGAYRDEGHVWVDELCEVLSNNINLACDFFTNVEGVTVTRPEATYMMLLDCEGFVKAHHMSMDELLKAGWDVGVGWQDGRPFFAPYGIRMNFAVPTHKVQEALERLKTYVFKD